MTVAGTNRRATRPDGVAAAAVGWSLPPGAEAPARRAVARVLGHPLPVGALVTGALAYLAAVDPNHPGHYPLCPFHALTGYWCPGCGGLRAVHDLLHGHVAAALSANLLVVVAAPFAVALWLRWTWHRLRPRRNPPEVPAPTGEEGQRRRNEGAAHAVHSRLWVLVLVLMLAFGVLRNLAGLSVLAP